MDGSVDWWMSRSVDWWINGLLESESSGIWLGSGSGIWVSVFMRVKMGVGFSRIYSDIVGWCQDQGGSPRCRESGSGQSASARLKAAGSEFSPESSAARGGRDSSVLR